MRKGIQLMFSVKGSSASWSMQKKLFLICNLVHWHNMKWLNSIKFNWIFFISKYLILRAKWNTIISISKQMFSMLHEESEMRYYTKRKAKLTDHPIKQAASHILENSLLPKQDFSNHTANLEKSQFFGLFSRWKIKNCTAFIQLFNFWIK